MTQLRPSTLRRTLIAICAATVLTGTTPASAQDALAIRHTDTELGVLYQISLQHGSASPIGAIFSSPFFRIDVRAIAFVGDDLFGIDIQADQLLKINPATGNATVVGDLGFNVAPGYANIDTAFRIPGAEAVGLSFDPTFSANGNLILTDFDMAYPIPPTSGPPAQTGGVRIYSVNTTTGLATAHAPEGPFPPANLFTDIAHRPGNTLFGFGIGQSFGTSPGSLYTFNNTNSGIVGSTPAGGAFQSADFITGSNIGLDATGTRLWGIADIGGEIFKVDGSDPAQIVRPAGQGLHGFNNLAIIVPPTVHWSKQTAGDWYDPDNWSERVVPRFSTDVVINPAGGGVASFPSTDSPKIKSLLIGGNDHGVAELRIPSYTTLRATNDVVIADRGRLSGIGDVNTTAGTITVEPGGEILAQGGEILRVFGDFVTPVENSGELNAIGGNITSSSFGGSVINHTNGQVNAVNGSIDFRSGLDNHGVVNLTASNANLRGAAGSVINRAPVDLAANTFFTDQDDWLEHVQNLESFRTTFENIKDLYTFDPTINDGTLGPSPDFFNVFTGLSRTFFLDTVQPGAEFIYNDSNNGGNIFPGLVDALSVGNVNEHEQDSFNITILTSGPTINAPPLTAFGLRFKNTTPEAGEILEFEDEFGTIFASTTNIPDNGPDGTFVGIITDTPIRLIRYLENAGIDDIAIADFMFATAAITGQINATNSNITFDGNGVSDDIGLVNLGVLNLTNTTIDGDIRSPAGSFINANAGVIFNGHVSGAATFPGAGLVTFNGTYAPGDSPAGVLIGGGVSFGPAATLEIELAGHTQGTEYDHVLVNGAASLDGTLNVLLINGFEDEIIPTDSFAVMTWDTNDATTFDNIALTLPTAMDGLSFIPFYFSNTLTLVADALDGDADLDGDVDLDDLVALAANFDTTVTERDWRLANFDFDTDVDADDLALMAANFFLPGSDTETYTSDALAALIGIQLNQSPEPATLGLLILLACLSPRRTTHA